MYDLPEWTAVQFNLQTIFKLKGTKLDALTGTFRCELSISSILRCFLWSIQILITQSLNGMKTKIPRHFHVFQGTSLLFSHIWCFFNWVHSLHNVWKTNFSTWLLTIVIHWSFGGRLYFSVNQEHYLSSYVQINTYSMKQPDLYYFETIKMTSQAWSNFASRIRAAGEYFLRTLTRLVTSFLWFQNGIDQAVS